MKGTMFDLFKAAGWENYKSMEINKFYPPKRKIGIASYENGKKVIKEVEYLVYKGESQSGYKVITPTSTFLATEEHKLFDIDKNDFVQIKDITNKQSFFGLDVFGNKAECIIEKCEDSFSILDMQVKDTHTYFSGGILSHNTFGSMAKALKEFCNRFIPLASEYNTTFLIISQERANLQVASHAICTTGGFALKYSAATSFRTRKIENLTEGSKIVGIHIHCKNYKNKTAVPFRECEMDLYFKDGFDSTCEYVDFLKEFNEDPRLVPFCYAGNGGVFKSEKYGWSFRGKDNFLEAIKKGQAEGWEEIKKIVLEIISNEIEGMENTADPEQDFEQNMTEEQAEQLTNEEIEQ